MAKSFLSIGKPKLQFANHNLSNDVKLTADFGYLYPVCVRECIPGDKIKYSVESVVRLNPTIAPVLHKMDIRFEAFFVPNRLVWNQWEEFITGGADGKSTVLPPIMSLTLSRADSDESTKLANSLWDYFGLPVFTNTSDLANAYNILSSEQKREFTPIQLPFKAYHLIWNEFYRDENIQDEFDIDPVNDNNLLPLQSRCWTKNDYFTSALPFVLRGFAPAINLDLSSLNIDVDLINNPIEVSSDDSISTSSIGTTPEYTNLLAGASYQSSDSKDLVFGMNSTRQLYTEVGGKLRAITSAEYTPPTQGEEASWDYVSNPYRSNVIVDSATASSNTPLAINASDIRWLMQVQKFLERNARGGSRYMEQVLSHFNVYTGDYRLQRPEFLGSTKSPIIVSEIPQTSASVDGSSPQANLAGKGIGAVSANLVKYRCKEHGYFMVLASIVPKLSYDSQGINKSFVKKDKFSYFFPEFSHLSEQPIWKDELYYQGGAPAPHISDNAFGYTGIYNEYRTYPDMVCGKMRDDFSYWHMARKFGNTPALNSDFISIAEENNFFDSDGNEAGLKRIFAVPSEPGFLVDVYNKCFISRPIPHLAEPGLVDHF